MVTLGTSLAISPVKGSKNFMESTSSPKSSILIASLSESAG